jgi:pimeloyl-ACP methyl ester carboxylesterase
MARYRPIVRAGKIAAGAFAGLMLLLALITAVADVLIGRAHPPIGRFIDTTSGRQHVLVVGPDTGARASAPTVVLVHGASANLNDMRIALVGRLRARHRVIALDRPGNGWSERAGGAADAAPRRQAAVLHEVLGKLGVERPVLLGHSWGGALATAYALDYPDALRGLVLVAPVTHPWGTGLPWHSILTNTPVLGALFAYTVALPAAYLTLDWFVALAFGPQQAPPGYVDRAAIALALRPAAIRANSADLAALEATIAAQAARYASIKTPAVIVAGTADRILRPRVHARSIAAELPQARLIMLRGVGHMPHHMAPERIVEAVEALAGVHDHNERIDVAPAAQPQ